MVFQHNSTKGWSDEKIFDAGDRNKHLAPRDFYGHCKHCSLARDFQLGLAFRQGQEEPLFESGFTTEVPLIEPGFTTEVPLIESGFTTEVPLIEPALAT